MLRYAILGLICYKEMSGYDILKRFEDSLSGIIYAQKSQVYKELKTLYEDGLVGMRQEDQELRPNKNIYYATEKGIDALTDWLLDLDESIHFKQRLPFVVKVYFSANIPGEELLRSLERFRGITLQAKEKIRKVRDHITANHRNDEHFLYWDMCTDYCDITVDAYLAWADRCIARLRGDP